MAAACTYCLCSSFTFVLCSIDYKLYSNDSCIWLSNKQFITFLVIFYFICVCKKFHFWCYCIWLFAKVWIEANIKGAGGGIEVAVAFNINRAQILMRSQYLQGAFSHYLHACHLRYKSELEKSQVPLRPKVWTWCLGCHLNAPHTLHAPHYVSQTQLVLLRAQDWLLGRGGEGREQSRHTSTL